MCRHSPNCPPADSAGRDAAHVVVSHPEQGWSLLCNGVVVFDDTGELLPDGRSVGPHRPGCPHRSGCPHVVAAAAA
jgi:hypothetical protein